MEAEIVGKESSLRAVTELLGRLCEGWIITGYGQYSPIYFQQKDDFRIERTVGNRGGRKWVINQTTVRREEAEVK